MKAGSRDLSRRLVALEAHSASDGCETVRVCERLRERLVKLVGVHGFRSLMARALHLARSEQPSLEVIGILPNGALEGFDRLGREECADAGVVVVAHLLELLQLFVGESLALRLVHDAWPSAADESCPPDSVGAGIDAGSGRPS